MRARLLDAGSSGEVGGLDIARSLIGDREVSFRRADESECFKLAFVFGCGGGMVIDSLGVDSLGECL